MIIAFLLSMNKSLFGKRLVTACSITIGDVLDGLYGISLIHFPDFIFHEGNGMVEKG